MIKVLLLLLLLSAGCSLFRSTPAERKLPPPLPADRPASLIPTTPSPAAKPESPGERTGHLLQPAPPAAEEKPAEPSPSYGRTAELRQRVAAVLERKQYRKAIWMVSRKGKKGYPLPQFEREYLAAVNGMIVEGEEAITSGDWGRAGRAFKGVAEVYPRETSLRERVSAPLERAVAAVETCSSRLMERGLLEYRKGNIPEATRLWKQILGFNPDHAQAAKALRTATGQIRTMKKMKPPPR